MAAATGKSAKNERRVSLRKKRLFMKKTNVDYAKNVTRDGIQCEICDTWNHSRCVGITAEAYEFISSNVQIH